MAPFAVVGIGASAGGLEAFSQLIGALPTDTGMAFVLIQHLDPTHKSHLKEILARATSMGVVEVADRMEIEPDHVYVIPPNSVLRLGNGLLRLTPRSLDPAPRLTIDAFFESLAATQGRLAIAVVLSGTGSDGAQGLKAIKSACGITFAQSEESAQYGEMPRNAMATGVADYVLPPARIADELARISHHRYVSPAGQDPNEILPEGEDELKQIHSLLLRATKVDFSHYKPTTFRRRMSRRMLVHGSEDLKNYLAYVRQHPDEVNELFKDLLINVTSFFRDPKAFFALREQLLSLVGSSGSRTSFRVWTPGCSTGEEVYSLAICAQSIFEEIGLQPNVQFFGTDIDEDALKVARAGVYGESSVRDVPAVYLDRYFRKVDGNYQISKPIRESCIFASQDVTRDTPFSHLDLISCRNLLIYLESGLHSGLMAIFHYGLNPSGLLFLGSAETIGTATDLFGTVDGEHKIYVRKPGPARLTQAFVTHRAAAEPLARAQVKESIGILELQKKVDRTIKSRYSPDCVVVNQNLQILEFRGHTDAYLRLPTGEATYDLLRMAREGLRYALHELLSHALQENLPAEKKGIPFEDGSVIRAVDLEVVPLAGASDPERFYLVVFKQGAPLPESDPLESTEVDAGRGNSLSARHDLELAEARQHLRVVSEDYEAALEEARASNEELQSANEELQSANEELATTKEELQSANEELTTVNEELDTRNQQLGALSDDLTNLFGAVDVPILRVDHELCLRRFSPAAAKFLGVTPSDLLHPIRLLQGRLASQVDFERLIGSVVETLRVESREIQDPRGCWWSLSIRPYRTADDHLNGAVLTFTDVNSIKEALQISQEARTYADAIVETVREPLVILGSQLRVERANAAFYEKFRLSHEQTKDRFFYELGNDQWAIPRLRAALKQISGSDDLLTDFEVRHTFPDLGERVMLINARKLHMDSQPRILVAFEDITDRRRTEESIANRLEKTDRELDRTKDELRALTGHLMTAHEVEQRRIARELHDDLVQRLGFLEFQVEQVRMVPIAKAHTEVASLLAGLQTQIATLSEVTRRISHGLHPSVIEDLGLVAALRKLAHDFSLDRKPSVRFIDRVGTYSLPKQHFAAAVYRIAQEALHNILKHAPVAEVTISLSRRRNQLLLTIRDNGPGFDTIAVRGGGGLGIVSMEERARLLGASFRIDARPGKGTTIRLRAPVPTSHDRETNTSSLEGEPHDQIRKDTG